MIRLTMRKPHPTSAEVISATEYWYQGAVGVELLVAEKQMVDQALVESFGYHLLQLSVCRNVRLYSNARIQHKYTCHPLPYTASGGLRSNFDELPFASGSLDAVILHHCHEFVEHPQHVLREVERVVVNQGQVIIIGFNPWSLLCGYGLLGRYFPNAMWHNHWLSRRRLNDWLALLGFRIKKQQFSYHGLPFSKSKNEQAQRWLSTFSPLGSFYCISAIKQQSTLTPSPLVWSKPVRSFSGLTSVKPRVIGQRKLKQREHEI